jgi:50S ribosomal subunit-associated GTPase HflX
MTAPMSSATFLGSGKVKELSELVKEHSATVVYFLNELSTSQVERLSALIGCEVVSYPNMD